MRSSQAPAIRILLLQGRSYREIRTTLNVSHSSISKEAASAGLIRRPRTEYDRVDVIAAYNAGATQRECGKRFGCCADTVSKILRQADLPARDRTAGLPTAIPLEEYIIRNAGKRHARANIRKKVLARDMVPYRCAECGNEGEWRGTPLILRLDHKDGNGGNHALHNLRFLCPNCDSQQPTYGHRNRGRYNGDVGRQANALVCETS